MDTGFIESVNCANIQTFIPSSDSISANISNEWQTKCQTHSGHCFWKQGHCLKKKCCRDERESNLENETEPLTFSVITEEKQQHCKSPTHTYTHTHMHKKKIPSLSYLLSPGAMSPWRLPGTVMQDARHLHIIKALMSGKQGQKLHLTSVSSLPSLVRGCGWKGTLRYWPCLPRVRFYSEGLIENGSFSSNFGGPFVPAYDLLAC